MTRVNRASKTYSADSSRNVAVVAHGGVGESMGRDGAQAAAEKGLAVLMRGGSALEAVVETVVVLEDDPRFNAGTGSRMKLDGTILMDAAVMDSGGRAGAVAAIREVKNPVLVARRVADTPHVLLVGDGAIRFAREMGFPSYNPATPDAVERLREARRRLKENDMPSWADPRWKRFVDLHPSLSGCDTVGAVARDSKGNYAVAASTGGVTFMLPGRVGDSPVIGAGFFAGPAGAVAATGIGEETMRRCLSLRVYDRMAAGLSPQRACRWGVRQIPAGIPIGLIAVGAGKGGRVEAGIAASDPMASARLVQR